MEGERIGERKSRELERKKKIPEEEISIEKAIDWLSEGNVARENGHFEEALKNYKMAFHIFEDFSAEHPKDKKVVAGFKESRNLLNETKIEWAKNLYNSGEKSITEGKQPEAIEYFQKTVKENPKLIEAWVKLGNLLTVSEKYENAHKNFKEGLRANQESKERWKIWNGLGKLFLQIGEVPRAHTCFLEARELNNESFAIDYNLGIVFLNLQIGNPVVNTLKAIEHLEEAEKKNPTSSEVTTAKGTALFELAQMGKSKETVANYEKVGKIWNEAIEKDPNNIWPWYNKGMLLPILQMGKPKDWLKESNGCFDEVFRILERRGEKKTEFTANVWYQKALIWKYWSDFNPHREKGHRNKDLKECAKCLNNSLKIMQPLYEQKTLTEDGQKMSIYAQTMLTGVKEELKKIEEWAKFGGAKKVKPTVDFNPMYA